MHASFLSFTHHSFILFALVHYEAVFLLTWGGGWVSLPSWGPLTSCMAWWGLLMSICCCSTATRDWTDATSSLLTLTPDSVHQTRHIFTQDSHLIIVTCVCVYVLGTTATCSIILLWFFSGFGFWGGSSGCSSSFARLWWLGTHSRLPIPGLPSPLSQSRLPLGKNGGMTYRGAPGFLQGIHEQIPFNKIICVKTNSSGCFSEFVKFRIPYRLFLSIVSQWQSLRRTFILFLDQSLCFLPYTDVALISRRFWGSGAVERWP